MKDQPTIQDVAVLSEVSIATVSRVLNVPDKVKEPTRTRVLDAIKTLGFIPKAEARARALRGSHRIGVVTPFFTAPAFVERMQGISTALAGKPYELVIYTVDSVNRFKGYLSSLSITHNLDGLIIISSPLETSDADQLLSRKLETVLIEYPQSKFCTVEIDDVAGGKMAAEYLIRKGHRRLAFLGDSHLPEYAIHPALNRLAGFKQAIEDAGLQLPDECIRLEPREQRKKRLAAREILSLPDRPTAIFAAGDTQAIGILKVARSMGFRVPQDLAVIGFDDLEMAELMDLTTIRQDLSESGRIAIELLLGRIKHPDRPIQHIRIPLTIIERETA